VGWATKYENKKRCDESKLGLWKNWISKMVFVLPEDAIWKIATRKWRGEQCRLVDWNSIKNSSTSHLAREDLRLLFLELPLVAAATPIPLLVVPKPPVLMKIPAPRSCRTASGSSFTARSKPSPQTWKERALKNRTWDLSSKIWVIQPKKTGGISPTQQFNKKRTTVMAP